MERSTRFKVLWTVWMSGGGIATAAVIPVITGSLGWAFVGLLASGIVLNATAQMVIQPVKAARGDRTASQAGRPAA
jgi:hypothetical protein